MDVSVNNIASNISLNKQNLATTKTKTHINNEQSVSLGEKEVLDTTLKSFLDGLFKDLSTNSKSKETVLNILKESNITNIIKDTVGELKTLLEMFKNDKSLNQIMEKLEKLLLHVENLDGESLKSQINKSGLFLESKLAGAKLEESVISQSIRQGISSLKEIIVDNKLHIDISFIDRLINSKVADKNFVNNLQEFMKNLNEVNENQKTVELIAKLEDLMQKNQLVESKITNKFPVNFEHIKSLTNEISTLLVKIESQNSKIKNITKELSLTLNTVSNMQNNNQMDFLKLNINEQLQRVVNMMKSELTQSEPQINAHVEISRLVQKLQVDVQSKILDRQLGANQKMYPKADIKQEIAQDIKANLLQIQDKITSSNSGVNTQDIFAKLDKILTNINYYQLLSYSANTNVLYLPLLWEGLEEGQVSIKKLKQRKYFCEINLKLKDFGKIELLVMLFDDININISVFAQNKEFLDTIRENLQVLKQGINSVGLLPSNIYIYDSLKGDKIRSNQKRYASNQQIGSGINLHV